MRNMFAWYVWFLHYLIMLHACSVRRSVFKNTPIDDKLQGVLENYEELLENIDDINKITSNDTLDLIEESCWLTYKCEEESYFRIAQVLSKGEADKIDFDMHGNVLQVDEKHIKVKTVQQVGWCNGKLQFKFWDMFTFLIVEEISSLCEYV